MKKYVGMMMGVVFGFAVAALALPTDKVEPYTGDEDSLDINLPDACSFPINLINNCGFEAGNYPPTGWTIFGDTSFTGVSGAAAYTGNFGLYAGPTSTLGGIRQNVTTTPGQTYALTFYLRNMNTPNSLRVSWNGNVIYSCDNCPNFGYTVFGINQLMATAASTEVSFAFYNLPDYFYLDDVIVVQCDER